MNSMSASQPVKRGKSKYRLPSSDWNFDNVPEFELAACCLWEYGRESIHITRSAVDFLGNAEAYKRGETPPRIEHDDDYDAFTEAYWKSNQANFQIYQTIRYHGGFAAEAWQQLPQQLRAKLAPQVSRRCAREPFEPAWLMELEDLWHANAGDWEKVRGQPPEYYRDDDIRASEPCIPLMIKEGYEAGTHGPTVMAFSIDFSQARNAELCEAFARWLQAQRPKDCPEPTARGHKRRDLRARLDRLGIMRLLHCYTLSEMPLKCPAAWCAFAGFDWYKERKRAAKTYLELFPFLPKSDLPLSWPTKGRRSTRC
jgi:hypothetical protein